MAAADRIAGQRAYGGVLLVDVRIADRRARLLVDTGCAVTTLTPVTVNRLGLDRNSFTGRRAVFTAGGASIVVPTGRIASLRIGVADLHNVEVALMELAPGVNLDGLLGVNVLVISERRSTSGTRCSCCARSRCGSHSATHEPPAAHPQAR